MRTQIKGINRVKARGHVYYYHRATKTRIHARFGSLEFAQEVSRLDRQFEASRDAEKGSKDKRGTLGELIAAYKSSPEFHGLSQVTIKDYLYVMDWLQPIKDIPIFKIDAPFMLKLRDKGFEQRKRRFANYLIAVVSILFNWGKPRGFTSINPASDVEKIKRPKGMDQANRPWSDKELETVLIESPPGVRIAVALAAYTGIRLGDVLVLPWSSFDGNAIAWKQNKTGEPVWIPVHSQLRSELERAPRVCPIIAANSHEKPWTINSLSGAFFRVIRRLVADGTVEPGLTFHGLRHTVGVALADAGCDSRTIMAITGHRTEAMVKLYTEGADKRSRATAGIARLEAHTSRERLKNKP